MRKINGAKILSQKFGLALNNVFGINSPVINTIIVESIVCTNIIKKELWINVDNGPSKIFAISIP